MRRYKNWRKKKKFERQIVRRERDLHYYFNKTNNMWCGCITRHGCEYIVEGPDLDEIKTALVYEPLLKNLKISHEFIQMTSKL